MQLPRESREIWFPLHLFPGLCGSFIEVYSASPLGYCLCPYMDETATEFGLPPQRFLFSPSAPWQSCFLSSKCCNYGGWLVLVGSDKASSPFDLWWNESCHIFHMCPFQLCDGNRSDWDMEERTRQNNNWCYQQQQEQKISFFRFSSYIFWHSWVNMCCLYNTQNLFLSGVS